MDVTIMQYDMVIKLWKYVGHGANAVCFARSFVSMQKNGRIIWASKGYWSTDLRRRTARTCFARGRRCPTTGSKGGNRWTAGTKKSNFTLSAANPLPLNQVIRVYNKYITVAVIITLQARVSGIIIFNLI